MGKKTRWVAQVLASTWVAAVAPLAASAQATSSPDERSPLAAALLQAALPPLPLGYLYAGNPARGLIPTGVMVVGSTLFLIEVVEVVDWTTNDESEALLYLGLAATVGGYVFGIVDAANVARQRNARLRAGGVVFGLVPREAGVVVALSIPVG